MCPVFSFCFVHVNFHGSVFSFQESLVPNAVISSCCPVTFLASPFSRKVYPGKCCRTRFEILLLLAQACFPLPVLMETVTYPTGRCLDSKRPLHLRAPFPTAPTLGAVVDPRCPTGVAPIGRAASGPVPAAGGAVAGSSAPGHQRQLRAGSQSGLWPFLMNLGYFLFLFLSTLIFLFETVHVPGAFYIPDKFLP